MRDLGATVVTAIHAYNPTIVVLAGGPMSAADLFLADVQARVDEYAFIFPKGRTVTLRTAELEDHAGVLGSSRGDERARGRRRMTFVRTVLGDVELEDLGPTYAHEHLVIDGGRPVELYPDFLLADVDRAVAELGPARALGLAAVDAMPASAGRNVRKLAEISRRSGVHIVAPTGLHLSRYYADDGWSETESAQQLAARFAADVTDGIDAHDYLGATIERTEHHAGVIKVAGSEASPIASDEPSRPPRSPMPPPAS